MGKPTTPSVVFSTIIFIVCFFAFTFVASAWCIAGYCSQTPGGSTTVRSSTSRAGAAGSWSVNGLGAQWNQELPSYAKFQNNGASANSCVPAIIDPSLVINYRASVEDSTGQSICGASIPTGTRVTFKPNTLTYNDIYWYAKGYYYDTPYGDPSPDAQPPAQVCDPKNIYQKKFKVTQTVWEDLYGTIAVHPPTISTSGLSEHFSCESTASDGSVSCVAASPGQVTAKISFAETFARPYQSTSRPNSSTCDESKSTWATVHRYTKAVDKPDGTGWHSCSGKGDSRIAIAPVEVSCPISIVPRAGGAPDAPAVTVGACIVGEEPIISIKSKDPDGDDVHFQFDWYADENPTDDRFDNGFDNNSGSLGPVGSEELYSTRGPVFSMAGTKYIKAIAIDKNNLSSTPTNITFTCADEATVGLTGDVTVVSTESEPEPEPVPIPNLRLTLKPTLVRAGATTQVHWSATNVASCSVSGTNGDGGSAVWSTIQSPLTIGQTSSPITQETMYTLTCLDLSPQRVPYTQEAKVRILPGYQEL